MHDNWKFDIHERQEFTLVTIWYFMVAMWRNFSRRFLMNTRGLRVQNDRRMTSSTANLLNEKRLLEYLPRCQMLIMLCFFIE